jgi:hypothetical protein
VAAIKAIKQAKKALRRLTTLTEALRTLVKPAADASAAQIVTVLKPLATQHQPPPNMGFKTFQT